MTDKNRDWKSKFINAVHVRLPLKTAIQLASSLVAAKNEYPLAPDIESCAYNKRLDMFTITFVDGQRIDLLAALIVGCPDDIIRWGVDEFRRGVVVTSAAGERFDFSGDFVLYATNDDFKAQVDAAAAAAERGEVDDG